jgi:hypothetical protein
MTMAGPALVVALLLQYLLGGAGTMAAEIEQDTDASSEC